MEAKAIQTDDSKVVVDFRKCNIFVRFGTPKANISNKGTRFCNRSVKTLFQKYNITHKVSTSYHLQTSGQAKVFNREVKSILEKTVNPNRKDWSLQLDDALWVCHPTSWYMVSLVIFQWNLNIKHSGQHRKLQVQELEEIRNDTYESSRIYKENTKLQNVLGSHIHPHEIYH